MRQLLPDEAPHHPRYRRLADALIADVRSGRLKVGTTLPGELELVARYGVSRHTVREALRVLEDLGLIDRQQGIGTVVRSRHSNQSYMQTVRSPAELLQYPADSGLYVASAGAVKANRKLARLLQCPSGTHWFRVSAVRRFRSSRVAINWLDLYLAPEFAAVAPLIGRRAQPVYELIEQKFGARVETVHVDIRASTITPELAGPLGAPEGSPSLRLIRRYMGSNRRVIQISVSEHPADRYTYSLELKRGWQASGGWSAG
ncbi:MAG TPA: GntR family transcriptional regulator [Steroidobacteraceae bacterium]|nr:GntR family transcriptional regulator [Steroidobacteraceae bacterium]